MIRLWFKFSIICTALCIILMAFAVVLGTLTSANPVLMGFEQCADMPCWLHIDLRTNTPEEAIAFLDARGYETVDNVNYLPPSGSDLCDLVLGQGFISDESKMSSLQLLNCGDLRLGDIIQLLGLPPLIANDCFNNWVLWYHNSIAVFITGDLLPYNRVSQIAFYNIDEFGVLPIGVPWHGFVPQWRYNQLEGNIRNC